MNIWVNHQQCWTIELCHNKKIINNYSKIHKTMKRLCSIQLFHSFKDHQCCMEKCDWLITTILGVSCIMLESMRFSLLIKSNRNSSKDTNAMKTSEKSCRCYEWLVILISHGYQHRNLKRKVWTLPEICKFMLQEV